MILPSTPQLADPSCQSAISGSFPLMCTRACACVCELLRGFPSLSSSQCVPLQLLLQPSGSGAFASLMRLAESAEQPQNAQSPAEAAATPAAAAAANTDASPETVVHSLAALQSENGLKLLNQHIRRQRSRKRSRKAWQPRLTLGDRVLDLSAGSSLQPAVERAAGNSEAQTPRRPLPSLPAMPLPLAGASPQPPAPPPGGARLFSTPGSLPPPLSICMPVSVGSSNLEIAALCSSQPEPRSIAGAVPPDASGPAAPTGADGRDSDRAELLAKLAEVQVRCGAAPV